MISVKELKVSFEDKFTLGPLEFALDAGTTAAFLGQNGAGKSTLFQLLTGNLDADQGEVRIFDKKMTVDNFGLKRQIGYLPQNHTLPPWVTGAEILAYAAKLHELENRKARIEQALSYWDATSYQNKPLAACSHGMQKRIGLAVATLHEPDLLILDEPFSGLDLFHIRALEKGIQERQAKGKVTILSTHIAPYCAKLCQSVYIMKNGQLSTLDQWSSQSSSSRVNLIEETFFGSL